MLREFRVVGSIEEGIAAIEGIYEACKGFVPGLAITSSTCKKSALIQPRMNHSGIRFSDRIGIGISPRPAAEGCETKGRATGSPHRGTVDGESLKVFADGKLTEYLRNIGNFARRVFFSIL